MKCLENNCDGIPFMKSAGSMGSCYSNYYKCNNCGVEPLIDDFGRIILKDSRKRKK